MNLKLSILKGGAPFYVTTPEDIARAGIKTGAIEIFKQ